MKFMGSKRWMLKNGLGHLISHEIKSATRFVDMFSGSGSVARFAATTEQPIEVVAYDIQRFSVVLAAAVITRIEPIAGKSVWEKWHSRASQKLESNRKAAHALEALPGLRAGFTQRYVEIIRSECEAEETMPITRAYGGYYFSRAQSLWLDALRSTLPRSEPERAVALAALIQAASQCSASPGHTAQPFAPSLGAKGYLREAWQRDIVARTKSALLSLAPLHAKKAGHAHVKDANLAALELRSGDVVFLDPPYSGVHYSRFYHVLETVAHGYCGQVEGSGRYPPPPERPKSRYSMSSEAGAALDSLLQKIAAQEATAILTFPQRACSNGLSGPAVRGIAEQYFKVHSTFKRSRFSTLGGTLDSKGNGYGRSPLQKTHELILTLTQR